MQRKWTPTLRSVKQTGNRCDPCTSSHLQIAWDLHHILPPDCLLVCHHVIKSFFHVKEDMVCTQLVWEGFHWTTSGASIWQRAQRFSACCRTRHFLVAVVYFEIIVFSRDKVHPDQALPWDHALRVLDSFLTPPVFFWNLAPPCWGVVCQFRLASLPALEGAFTEQTGCVSRSFFGYLVVALLSWPRIWCRGVWKLNKPPYVTEAYFWLLLLWKLVLLQRPEIAQKLSKDL